MKEDALFLIIELLLGVSGAWLVSRFASNFGLIDAPSERSSHLLPTPKGGGIGILCAFVYGCFVFELNLLFCLAVTFLSLFSLVGDRTHLSPVVRLILQFATAFIILFAMPESPFFISLDNFTPGYNLLMLFLGGICTAFFIVGTANFYNFMDGINGIAAITGVVGFGLLAGYGLSYGKDYNYILLCTGLVVACLGFLPFNIPKAKVFMGDVGSILLGFVFAVVVVMFAETLAEFIVLSSFLLPFYADELLCMAERIGRHQSLTTPHRRHLYQVLANEAGIPHWRVSLGYGIFQLVVGVCAWQVSQFGLLSLAGCLVFWGMMFFLVNNVVKNKYGNS